MSCYMSSNALFKTDFNTLYIHSNSVFLLFNPSGIFQVQSLFLKFLTSFAHQNKKLSQHGSNLL